MNDSFGNGKTADSLYNEDINFIDALAELVVKEDAKEHVVNERAEEIVKTIYEVMTKFVTGRNVQVSYKLHQPFKTSGSVTVVGEYFSVMSPKLFVKSASLADNIEVYPKTDGTVELDFSFNNLATRVGD